MRIFIPTKIFFETDIVDFKFDNNIKNVLIISTKSSAIKSGALDEVTTCLKNKNIVYDYLDNIRANPTFEMLDSIIHKTIGKSYDLIISIGGGSAIDAGKAISVMIANNFNSSDLLKFYNEDLPNIKHLAIPTTAGTGSETSKGSILTDPINNWKGGIRGDNLFCYAAIINSKYMNSLDEYLTLQTGFDAFTHAFESFLSKASNNFTKALSIEALKKIIPALLDFSCLEDKSNNKKLSLIRKDLAYGSTLAGINLGNASTCLPHRLQYCIGSINNTAHADGLALIYPFWINEGLNNSNTELKKLLEIIRKIDNRLDVKNPIEGLLDKINMKKNYNDLLLHPSDKERLLSYVDGSLELDPIYNNHETINNIFEGIFK